jgi:hypothetical protein
MGPLAILVQQVILALLEHKAIQVGLPVPLVLLVLLVSVQQARRVLLVPVFQVQQERQAHPVRLVFRVKLAVLLVQSVLQDLPVCRARQGIQEHLVHRVHLVRQAQPVQLVFKVILAVLLVLPVRLALQVLLVSRVLLVQSERPVSVHQAQQALLVPLAYRGKQVLV